MISNINELKAELKKYQCFKNIHIFGLIFYSSKMIGCSESEIREIEKKYGKLPFSYRQILGLIGHSFDFFTTDLKLYTLLLSLSEN